MAIDKSLLDDIAPSDSAVSRLKKKPRRIKPWESDLLLRSPDEKTALEVKTESVATTSPELSPISVCTTEAVLSSDSGLRTKVGPDPLSTTRRSYTGFESPSISNPILGNRSVPSTVPGLSTKIHLGTETVLSTVTWAGARLDVSANSESATNSAPPIQETDEIGDDTEAELSAGEQLRHRSVLGTEVTPNNQLGATPKVRRAYAPSGHPKKVQPYVVLESENFTRVPHAVTEALQREDFSSRQFRILVTILRETIGWGREYAELSAKDFAEKTGIASSHIFITLRDLEDQGVIIRRVNGRNAKNSYALNRGFFAKHPTKRGPGGGFSGGSTDPVAGTEGMLTSDLVSKLSSDSVLDTHHQSGAIKSEVSCLNFNKIRTGKKDIKKLKNSLAELPECLRSLIEPIRPAAKRESERECAFELLAEYPAEELAEAVVYLRGKGVLGTGEPCHSPFKYLTSAAEQVLAQVSKVRPKSLVNLQPQPEPSSAEEVHEEAVSLFENSLSEEAKQECIAKYIELELSHGFLPPQGVLRKLVALNWFREQRKDCALRLVGTVSEGKSMTSGMDDDNNIWAERDCIEPLSRPANY